MAVGLLPDYTYDVRVAASFLLLVVMALCFRAWRPASKLPPMRKYIEDEANIAGLKCNLTFPKKEFKVGEKIKGTIACVYNGSQTIDHWFSATFVGFDKNGDAVPSCPQGGSLDRLRARSMLVVSGETIYDRGIVNDSLCFPGPGIYEIVGIAKGYQLVTRNTQQSVYARTDTVGVRLFR